MSQRVIEPARKVIRFPEHLAVLQQGRTPWPIHVEMDLSNRCNLKCRWCDFRYTHDGRTMDTGLAVDILRQLKQVGVKAVTFTGGGEPTMHPDFGDIVRVAFSLGLELGLYSNLLNVTQLRSVIDAFSWVYGSLDATTSEEYAEMKGVRSGFRLVTGNIRDLVALHDPAQTQIGVGFLLGEQSWRNIEQAQQIAADLDADYVQFRPLVGIEDYGWVPSAILALANLPEDLIPTYWSEARFLEMLGFKRSYSICRGSALVPCIGAGGELWVCVNTRGSRLLGDLADEDFAEIWRRRGVQMVDADCRVSCRNHAMNETLEYVCGGGLHACFV